MCFCVSRNADFQLSDFFLHAGDKFISRIFADGDSHRQRHATLTGRAISCARKVSNNLIHICIRHDDAVVFCAAHSLYAFTVGCAVGINIVSNIRGTDKTDCFDIWVGQDGIHGGFITMNNIQDTVRQSGFVMSSASLRGTVGSFSDGLRIKALPHAIATPNIHRGSWQGS